MSLVNITLYQHDDIFESQDNTQIEEYLNNTTTSNPENSDDAFVDCMDTLKAIFTYIELPVAIIGVVGNIISALVFCMDRKKYSSHTLLTALAIVDSLFLVCNECVQVLEWYMHPETNCNVRFVVLKVLHPGVHILHTTIIWMTLLIAVNRFIAICRPFAVSFWCTKKKTYFLLVLVFVTAVIYNIPRFFEYTVNNVIEESANGASSFHCELKALPVHHSLVYNGLMYFTFITIGPMIIIVGLYCRIIQDLKQQTIKGKMGRKDLPSALRTIEERQATNSILAIITIFIIVQCLVTISRLMQTFSVVSCGPARYYHVTVDLMVVFNSSVNFVLYCAIRKTFRKRLKRLFCTINPTYSSESDPYAT